MFPAEMVAKLLATATNICRLQLGNSVLFKSYNLVKIWHKHAYSDVYNIDDF